MFLSYVYDKTQDCVSGVMIPHGMIQSRVEKLAADILRDYDGLTPHFLCVLQVRFDFSFVNLLIITCATVSFYLVYVFHFFFFFSSTRRVDSGSTLI